MTWLAVSANLLLNPFSSLVRTLYAQSRRILLPKDTDRKTLKSKNPRTLDTTNLEVTPLAEFDTMGQTDIEVDIESWRLKITGLVESPLDLSYDDVRTLPSIERKVLLICPGFFANHGKWKGISMKSLLEKVRPNQGVTHVKFIGPKGDVEKTERFPLADIQSDKVFLAYDVNDKPLSQKHGFPLRVVAQDYYGDDWVKYVYHVEFEKS